MLRLRPVQLKEAVDALNLKTLDQLTAAAYKSAATSIDGTGFNELLDEQEEQGDDLTRDLTPRLTSNAGPVDGDVLAAMADSDGNGAGAGAGNDGASGAGGGADDDDNDYDDDAAFENIAPDEITPQPWEQHVNTLADPLAAVDVLPT